MAGETIAYQGFGAWAWGWLPVSAVVELTAVTIFAINLATTLTRAGRKQY